MMLKSPLVGGILLVAGTAIGAGMLALPLTTGVAGFLPACLLISAAFAYMLLTLFALLEANLYMTDQRANIITMSKTLLGPWAQAIAWMAFLLLLYAASAAYIAGGGDLLLAFKHVIPSLSFTHTQSALLFTALFGGIAFFGIRWIDGLNRLLMFGLIATYILLTISVAPHLHASHLSAFAPEFLWRATPIVVLSFTSHIVLPSLRDYLNDDIGALKKVLLFGSMIPLIFYLVWELLLVGTIPHGGPNSMLHIARSPQPLAHLQHVFHNLKLDWIGLNNQAFSFFAIATSFLGVVLSLSDFIADGFKIKANTQGRAVTTAITIIPPVIFALCFPSGFTLALDYAGVFVAVLYGILPPMMIWKARYVEQRPQPVYQLPGGKAMLIGCMTGGVMVIALQILSTLNHLPRP